MITQCITDMECGDKSSSVTISQFLHCLAEHSIAQLSVWVQLYGLALGKPVTKTSSNLYHQEAITDKMTT